MDPVVTPINQTNQNMAKNKTWPFVLGAFAVVVLGVGSAWLISSKLMNKNTVGAAPGAKVTSTEAGLLDANTKYDNATGDLKDGGIGNEGTHHIEREGGPSHFVYLTSSVIDLSSFVGKKVQVWGQTLASKKAGWLMDVAKIQVVQ
ncbi:MAG TPA: hypothetical protein VKC53_02315 [Patescibacteria group bacterium]|nr:hypothetical protein [Patescibacteria group bacterium]